MLSCVTGISTVLLFHIKYLQVRLGYYSVNRVHGIGNPSSGIKLLWRIRCFYITMFVGLTG